MKGKYVQLKDNLQIDVDNKVNVFSQLLPNLGRIHKVLDETRTEIKIKTVWLWKKQVIKVYGDKPPNAMFVY